jgi:hypothetical protein
MNDPIIIAICVCMTAAVGVYVFYLRDNDTVGQNKTRLEYLRERKEVVYDNLRDLNFDYKAGKVPDVDYQQMHAALEDEAVAVLAEIEQLESAELHHLYQA